MLKPIIKNLISRALNYLMAASKTARRIDVHALMFRNFEIRRRAFHQREIYLDNMLSHDLRARYRVGRPALKHISNIIKPHLETKTNRNKSISH